MSDNSIRTGPGTSWRDRAGRIVLDLFDAHGNVVSTPMDRRWLWRIEGYLGVSATTDGQRRLARDLRAYLNETCGHHWIQHAESRWEHPDAGTVQDVIPAHRQCLWCNDVEWDGEAAKS